MLRPKTRQPDTSQASTLARVLLRTLRMRDPMTARHSVAVAGWATEIAVATGRSKREQQLAHTAGLLHDIGKLTFPDRILKRDVKLTDHDWERIQSHPGEGARVLADVEGCEEVREIVLSHHERPDGEGYPRGLSGDEIPPIARMIAVADTFDAMTARHSYRHPVTRDDAVAELRRVAGTQLDPEFVEVFIDRLTRRRPTRSRFGHFMRLEVAS
jgi:putative nucleotidyltransferase with HDIG domain